MYRSFLSRRYLTARLINLIGIGGVFVAVGALVLIVSIMSGFLEESRRAVRGSLADLLVLPRHESGNPASAEPLLEAIRADGRVAGSAAELVWAGQISQPGRQFQRVYSSPIAGGATLVQLVGIDVPDEFSASELLPALSGERPLSYPVADPLDPFAPPRDYAPRGRPKASVVVGEELLRSLDLAPHDEIQITTGVPDPATGDFKPNNRTFVIAGSFRSGENETDLSRIYLDRRELADFLGGTLEFSQVLIKLEDYERDGLALRDDLRQDLAHKGLIADVDEVRTWEELKRNLLGAISNERVLMMIMLSLVLLVAGFTIFAILSMMVTEKRRDIGILCALGATPTGVLELFVRIALWDSVIGSFFGACLGTWAALRLDAIERWLSRVLGVEIFDRQVYLFDHIPTIVEPLFVLAFVVSAILVAVLFSVLPAWRASRLDPVQALRYE